MHDRLLATALAVVILAAAACSSPPATSGPALSTITVCGTVEVDRTDAGTALILRDARSGSRFGLAIPAEARAEFVQALGGEPEAVLDGASVCATGTLRGDDTLEVAEPGAVKIHPPRGE